MCKCCIRLLFVCLLIIPFSACLAQEDADLWNQACAKIDAGDLAGAAVLFNQLLTDYPSSSKAPGAQLKLAYIKMKTSPDSTVEQLNAFSLVRSKYSPGP